jgi:hypothetical protein
MSAEAEAQGASGTCARSYRESVHAASLRDSAPLWGVVATSENIIVVLLSKGQLHDARVRAHLATKQHIAPHDSLAM